MAKEKQENSCKNCIISKFSNFRVLSEDELKEVSNAKVTKKINKGETIFDEGEHLNGVFCIRDGVSKVSKMSSNGKDQILKLVTKGDLLGQSAIISNDRSKLKATAVNNMEVCFIPKEKIIIPLKENPEFSMSILKTMAKDLNESNESILLFSQKNVKQRIAQALLYIKDTYGEDSEGFLNLNLTREDLANVVGTAIESCIRSISALKKEGYINLSRKKIKILDFRKLERFLEDFEN